jgi:2-oxoisovalerate dehydrogenase E2 component (dihydrolipoyl transacylase)
MAEHVIKLPDVGEGVAEAELVEWHVKVGDIVREDAVLAAVMTDKATVEIPSPVDGTVAWLGAEIGDTVAVGAALVKLEVAGDAESEPPTAGPARPEPSEPEPPKPEPPRPQPPKPAPTPAPAPAAPPRPAAAAATTGFREIFMLNLYVRFMSWVFWLPPLNFLVKVT